MTLTFLSCATDAIKNNKNKCCRKTNNEEQHDETLKWRHIMISKSLVLSLLYSFANLTTSEFGITLQSFPYTFTLTDLTASFGILKALVSPILVSPLSSNHKSQWPNWCITWIEKTENGEMGIRQSEPKASNTAITHISKSA